MDASPLSTSPAAGSPIGTHATPSDGPTVEARDAIAAGPTTGEVETELAEFRAALADDGGMAGSILERLARAQAVVDAYRDEQSLALILAAVRALSEVMP